MKFWINMPENQPFFYWELPTVSVNDDWIQHICGDLCGGKCCSDQPFGDFRPVVDEPSAKAIEEFTGKPREEFIEIQEGTGILVLKRDDKGHCVFESKGCSIHPVKPIDCRRFPENFIAFPLAKLVMKMPIDFPECLLSQVLLGKIIPSEDGNILEEVAQAVVERDRSYWRMIARLIGETPTDEEVMDEDFKREVRESILKHWLNPHNHLQPTLENLPPGTSFIPTARLTLNPEEPSAR